MTIVWTNGCFDVLHRGHIELLKYAKSLGDYLVVGIDDDARVKASKGDSRPFNRVEDRMAMLEAIRYVDEVCVFDIDCELTTQILVSGAQIIVVGDDYKDKEVIGSHLSQIDEVVFFKRLGDYSTTNILKNKEELI